MPPFFLCAHGTETAVSYWLDIHGDRFAIGADFDIETHALTFMQCRRARKPDFRIPYKTRGSMHFCSCPCGRIILNGVHFNSAGHCILPRGTSSNRGADFNYARQPFDRLMANTY